MRYLLVEPKIKQPGNTHGQFVGLLRIANWMQSKGHKIQYVKYPDLASDAPDEVYVTSMFTYHYPEVWEAVRYYKNWYPQAIVKLGGIYATLCPEHAQQSGADEVVIGQHPEAKDYAPDPSVILVDRPDYAYLFTSYGCQFNCTFCATHLLYGRGIRQVNPDIVLDEIEFLISKGFKKILLGDDNILCNSESHINVICEKILQRDIKGLHLSVPGGMSAKDWTLETAQLMKKAGFKTIALGLESTDPDVLKQMGRARNTQIEDIEKAAEICDQVKFHRSHTDVFFVIGLPFQTIDEMLNTLLYLARLGFWAHPKRLTPIPGTPDFKRMNLEEWDLADLHYKKFVAPNQDNFTHEDLEAINKIARSVNMGNRYTNFNWLAREGHVAETFRSMVNSAE